MKVDAAIKGKAAAAADDATMLMIMMVIFMTILRNRVSLFSPILVKASSRVLTSTKSGPK